MNLQLLYIYTFILHLRDGSTSEYMLYSPTSSHGSSHQLLNSSERVTWLLKMKI